MIHFHHVNSKVGFPSQMATLILHQNLIPYEFSIIFSSTSICRTTLHLSFQHIVPLQIKYTLPSTSVETANSASSWTPLDLPLELLSICRSAVMIGSEICGASAGVTLRNTLWNKTVTLNIYARSFIKLLTNVQYRTCILAQKTRLVPMQCLGWRKFFNPEYNLYSWQFM